MRVARRVAEPAVDAVDERVRDGVLQHLGLVVHFVPPVAEHLDEERLEQPVPPHHRHRVRATGLGELDAPVRLVHEEALLGEAADAVRDGGRPHAHPFRQLFDA